jgi:hypothetical protein
MKWFKTDVSALSIFKDLDVCLDILTLEDGVDT